MIDAARERLEPTGRIVVEVRVDGRTVTGEDLDDLLDRSAEAEEVQLVTADPFELAQTTLEDVKESLGLARDAQQQAAEGLNADDAAAALEHVRTALGVWQRAQLAVQQTARLIGLPLDEMTVGGRPLPEVIDGLAQQLAVIRDQLISSDWIGLADTLGHEMDDTAATWEEMLDAIMERIGDTKNKKG